MLKISTKISLLYFVATAIIIMMMAGSTYFIFFNQRLQSIDDELHDYAHFLTTDHDFVASDLETTFRKMTHRRDNSKRNMKFNYNFILITKDSVVYESDERLNLDKIIKNIMDYDEKKDKKEYSTLDIGQASYRLFEYKMDPHNRMKELDIIMVASLDRFNDSLREISYVLFFLSPLFLMIAAIIGYIIAKRSFAPVRNITATAESITGADLTKRVPVGTAEDELSMLARTFNDMIARINLSFESQKRFIADASHDFRTPLTIIRLELELLKKKFDEHSENLEIIDKCLNEIKSLSALSENLLILARADAHQLKLNPGKFRFDELVLDCISFYGKIAEKSGHSFRVDMEDIDEIEADKEMLKRAIINSIDNAVKYSSSGSVIDITLRNSSGRVIYEISNPGDTLSSEQIAKYMNRFQREELSRTTKGHGLGLPIIQAIVDSHGGNIQFISLEGVNTLRIEI
jgi:signal transduction histidine kinase